MRLVISFIVKTEDGENLILLLEINNIPYNYRFILITIYLEISGGGHKTLSSSLISSRSAYKTLSKHHRLRSKHDKRLLRNRETLKPGGQSINMAVIIHIIAIV